MQHDVRLHVRGKWRGILSSLGIDDKALTGRHGPCPMCAGTDRFRWDNKEGKGSWFCNQCGAGDGFDLLMRFKGWDFKTAAREIEAVVGLVKTEAVSPVVSDAKRREFLREIWKQSLPIMNGDQSDVYLRNRGLDHDYPEALRTAKVCRYSEGQSFPAMIGVVSNPDGKPVSLHRTWLEGLDKANVESPRKLMPGTIPDGSAIRLGPVKDTLGIAEGIETALAASMLFECVVWAAVSSRMLEKWTPPEGVSEVCIFADNDGKFGGQAAAYALAHRLAVKGLDVRVRVPPNEGEDWNDVLLAGMTG